MTSLRLRVVVGLLAVLTAVPAQAVVFISSSGSCTLTASDDMTSAAFTDALNVDGTDCTVSNPSGKLRFEATTTNCTPGAETYFYAGFNTDLGSVHQWACVEQDAVNATPVTDFLLTGPALRMGSASATDGAWFATGMAIGHNLFYARQPNPYGDFLSSTISTISAGEVLCTRVSGLGDDTVIDWWRDPTPTAAAGGTPDDWALHTGDHACISKDGVDVEGNAGCIVETALNVVGNQTDVGNFAGLGVRARPASDTGDSYDFDEWYVGTCDISTYHTGR